MDTIQKTSLSTNVSPPREKFPARAIHTPPLRARGMEGNRPFNREPSTKGVKARLETVGFHGFHYTIRIDKVKL